MDRKQLITGLIVQSLLRDSEIKYSLALKKINNSFDVKLSKVRKDKRYYETLIEAQNIYNKSNREFVEPIHINVPKLIKFILNTEPLLLKPYKLNMKFIDALIAQMGEDNFNMNTIRVRKSLIEKIKGDG